MVSCCLSGVVLTRIGELCPRCSATRLGGLPLDGCSRSEHLMRDGGHCLSVHFGAGSGFTEVMAMVRTYEVAPLNLTYIGVSRRHAATAAGTSYW